MSAARGSGSPRVRVRLSARALVVNVTGATNDATGENAIRGSLVTEVAPRAASSARHEVT